MSNKQNGRTRVLAIDDDQDLLATLEIQLHLKGYAVQTARTASEGIATAVSMAPDIVLLDIGLPDKGGLEVISELRSNFATACSGIIMITAQAEQSTMREAVSAGADDYILKPYDPSELCNRIEMVKERTSRNMERNPLTGLPGNNLIGEELKRRIGEHQALAFGYVDIDNFKAFNDRYGPEVGDQMIRVVGNALVAAVQQQGGTTDFVGHIGGDDFIFLTTPENLHAMAETLFKTFCDETAPLYDPVDLRRGGIEARGRDGVNRRFPICTLSVGATSSIHATIESAQRAFELATKAKHFAKSRSGDRLEIWGETKAATGSGTPAKRLLIVENDLNLAYDLTLGMEQKGYECKTVEKVETASEAVRSFSPDILFADATLLASDQGRALMNQIREADPFLHLPVVAISGDIIQSNSSGIAPFGADLLLTKPLDLDEVDKSVAALLA